MARIAGFVPDLMDRSKLAGLDVAFLRSPDAPLPDGCEVVVVDLDRAGDLTGRVPADVRVIGFGSHVRRDLFDAARAAGITETMPRSELFRKLPDVLMG
jgi:hypothetical protein